MNARWPSAMPLPLRDGFSQASLPTRIRRATDVGPPSYRSRFSRRMPATAMTFEVDRDGLEVFYRFYEDDTRGGSLPFWMPDPLTDEWPLTDETGSVLITPEGDTLLASAVDLVVFAEAEPQVAPIGVRFRITIQVVRLR